jgi:carboxyl-terminal processing protease
VAQFGEDELSMSLAQVRTFAVALMFCTLGACASFDPYNVVGRVAVKDASRDADGFVRTLNAEEKRAERRANVELVWTTIRDRYYRADLNGVDWNAARAKWEPLIVDAPNEDEYWQRLDRLAGELADAHTRVESPTQVEARRNQRVLSLGLSMREMDEKLVVTGVNTDSNAFFAGLRVGMTIVAINASPALKTWRAWIADARPSSTPIATRGAATRKLNDLAKTDGIEIEFERFDGTRERVRLKSREISTRPTVSHRVLPSGFGYVRLTAFSESLRGSLLAGIDALKDTPGLILDLRGNRGGSLAMANTLIGAFFKEKTDIGQATTRTNSPVTMAFGAVKLIPLERSVPGRKDAYAGKLVVLIDNDSASGSETVATVLQSTRRAHVIGETSCGCLLAYLGYAQLNGGGEIAYSEVGFIDKLGRTTEKEGVTPDSFISRTIADLRDGRDRVLEFAQSYLAK